MRKKIIGIILLVLIVFGGYKLFANVSANNVNSNSIQFSYEDIPAYNGDNPYVVVNDNKPYFTSSEIVKDSYIKYGPLDSIKRVTSAMACLDYDSMPSEDDKKGESKSICPTGWNNIKYDSIAGDGYCQSRAQSIAWCFGGSDTDKKNYLICLNSSRDTGRDYMSMYDIRATIDSNIDYTISSNYYIKNIDKYVMSGEILTLNKKINTFHPKDVANMKKMALDLIDDRHIKEGK